MEGQVMLRVRLLPDPPLWCWELVGEDGAVRDGSFCREWAAYRSPEEALRAARAAIGPAMRKLPCRIEGAERLPLSA